MNLRRFIIFLLAMTVTASTLSALKLTDKTRFVIADVGLRMRDAPELGANKLGVIPFNQPVTLLEESGEEQTIAGATGRWSKVDWKGKVGWVFGGFLAKEFVMPQIDVIPHDVMELLHRGEFWMEVPYDGSWFFFQFESGDCSFGYYGTGAFFRGGFNYEPASDLIMVAGSDMIGDGSEFHFARSFKILYISRNFLVLRVEDRDSIKPQNSIIKLIRSERPY